jgi:hypothetical protein
MPSSGVLHHVALVRIDVSEDRIASIIGVKRISELGTTLAVTSNRSTRKINVGDKFLRNVGSYKSHETSYSRRRHSSGYTLSPIFTCSPYAFRIEYRVTTFYRETRPGKNNFHILEIITKIAYTHYNFLL